MDMDILVSKLAESMIEHDRDGCNQMLSVIESHPDYHDGNKCNIKSMLFSELGISVTHKKFNSRLGKIVDIYMYLMDVVIKPENVAKMLTKNPSITNRDIPGINSNISFLLNEGIPCNEIGRVIMRNPAVIEERHERIHSKIYCLLDMGMAKAEIVEMIVRDSTVLKLSIENNIRPTFSYLRYEMGAAVEDIVSSPVMMGLSLDFRIKPRNEFIIYKGLGNRYKPSTVLNGNENNLVRLAGSTKREFSDFMITYLSGMMKMMELNDDQDKFVEAVRRLAKYANKGQ